MLSKTLILAAAATGLMAGAAFAQSAAAPSYPDKSLTPPDQIQNSPFSDKTVNPMPAPANSVAPSAAAPAAQSNVSANVSDTASISSLPPGSTLTNELVTNGPVPDTRANRAKYGAPDSRAGKMTRPAGN
jgi:hypothetical protein